MVVFDDVVKVVVVDVVVGVGLLMEFVFVNFDDVDKVEFEVSKSSNESNCCCCCCCC